MAEIGMGGCFKSSGMFCVDLGDAYMGLFSLQSFIGGEWLM